ncbi:MAG: hypothetical protein ACREPL_12840 [Rhodanobacteraceae bacterium]
MDSYSYRIDRRQERAGGGWRLQLLRNGVEVDAQVYPAPANKPRMQQQAYTKALRRATAWLAAHRNVESPP